MNTILPWAAAAAIVASASDASAQSFKVVTSNLWHGATHGCDASTGSELGPSATRAGVANFLKSKLGSSSGLVALQEVHVRTSDSALVDVPDVLAHALGSTWESYFGATRDYHGGAFGNAALSNVSVTQEQSWLFSFDPDNEANYGTEQRGAQAIKAVFDGHPLWFVSVHLDVLDVVAVDQLWELLGRMATFDPDFPVIVAGDFNANVASAHNPVFKALFGDSTLAGQDSVSGFRTVCDTKVKTSFKNLSSDTDRCLKDTPESENAIDYIYLRDPHGRIESLGCSAHDVRSGSQFFTDHRSLVASFRWR